MQHFLRLSLVSSLFVCGSLLAQEAPANLEPVSSSDVSSSSLSASNAVLPNPLLPSVTAPLSVAYTPLDLKDKYLYSVNQTFTFPKFAIMGIRAGLDHYKHTPNQWDTETSGYAMRFASHLGRSLVREQIAFGVRAIDHEDPRYFRLGHGTIRERTKYAISRTFLARKDDGTWMPAYSRFIASYSMPFIASRWRPEPVRTLPMDLKAGTVGISLGMATNICQEFMPEFKGLKAKLRHQ